MAVLHREGTAWRSHTDTLDAFLNSIELLNVKRNLNKSTYVRPSDLVQNIQGV